MRPVKANGAEVFLFCKAVAALQRKKKLMSSFQALLRIQVKRQISGQQGRKTRINLLLVTPETLMKAFQRTVGLCFILSSCPAGRRSLKDAGWDQAESNCRSSWSLTEPSHHCHKLSQIACASWKSFGNKMHALR